VVILSPPLALALALLVSAFVAAAAGGQD